MVRPKKIKFCSNLNENNNVSNEHNENNGINESNITNESNETKEAKETKETKEKKQIYIKRNQKEGINCSEDNLQNVEKSEKSRIKRKKKNNFNCSTYSINNEIENPALCSDNENIIMHLNFDSNNTYDKEMYTCIGKDDLLKNNQNNQPFPISNDNENCFETVNKYFFNDQFNIFNNKFIDDFSLDDKKDNHDINENSENKVVKLLKDFRHSENKEWPISTNISCYWCCHKFFNEPFGIPIKYLENGQFQVFGCFCSLECAQAYNFSQQNEIDEIWERSNLINYLCRKLNYNKQGFVKPAPPRLSLKTFGGYLTIEEFRNMCNKEKIIHINFPPMLTVTQQIEEINESDINNDYKYIPINTERINRYKEKIRLKRNKPVHDTRNTLDNAINIKITSKKTNSELNQ